MSQELYKVRNEIKLALKDNLKLSNILADAIDENVITAFNLGKNVFPYTPLKVFKHIPDDIKVVILGQDPYYTLGHCKLTKKIIPYATGVAFGVPNTISKIPPSLKNILKEANSTTKDYSLLSWVDQGVLLLNTALTVELDKPNSHVDYYKDFTKNIISKISSNYDGVIFLLWGNNAKFYEQYINKNTSYILKAAHPSPLSASRGFFGCGHFKETNRILKELGKEPIKW
jgi:uracil-DNA glycosylase